MIADGSLKAGTRHRRDDVFQDRAACDDGPTAVVRRAEAQHAAGAGGAFANTRAGPKKIKVLYDELKIDSLADLRAAGESGKIAMMKGFGAKTQANILAGISFVEKSSERILQSTARRLVAPIVEQLKHHRDVIRIEVCGSLRRRAETIGDLDVLISSANVAAVLDAFVKLPQVATVLAHGPTKASVRLADGVQCDLRGVDDAQFPFALHYFTGSKAHNIAMRKRAIARGLSLNEYALAGEKGSVPCKTEADVFKALGLLEIPPELREDSGEIEAAEAGKLPDLIEFGDLTGTFHCHTDWSDGSDTLAEMAQAARTGEWPIWGSPIIRDRPPMPGACRSSGCASSGRRSTRSINRSAESFTCSRGPSATFCPTGRSTIRTNCSRASITLWRASIRISGCRAKP